MPEQNDDDTRATERELRDQIRELQEQARILKEQARATERERADREREERHRGREEYRRREEERRHRDERGPRRGGPRMVGFGFPPGPPPPGMPGMPLPPIPGAGGTFSPFDIFGALFGHTPPPRRGRGRGRAGRGDVRITILLLLDEGPANGYQLMQEIEQRTGGAWKPSSGSIYPALQQLEDEGIVEAGGEGRKVFSLTEQGRAHVREHRSEWTPPWENLEEEEGPSEEAVRIRDLVAQLAMAYMQVIQVGTESQRAEAGRVLVGARQALYRILAGDTGDDGDRAAHEA